jgi:hypothetical protein
MLLTLMEYKFYLRDTTSPCKLEKKRCEFPLKNMSILKHLSLSEREVLLALKMSLPRESESFYPLENFENEDSELAVKMLFR